MRKIRKIIFCTFLVVGVLGLTACGKEDKNNGSSNTNSSSEKSTTQKDEQNTTGKLNQLGKNVETIFDDAGTMIKDLVK